MIIEPEIAESGESEVRIGDYSIGNSDKEKLLGLMFDNYLMFDHHIKKIICNKAGQKISALARIAPYLDVEKRKLLII